MAFAARSAEVAFCLQFALELTCLSDCAAVTLANRLDMRKEQLLQAHGQGVSLSFLVCSLCISTVRAENGETSEV